MKQPMMTVATYLATNATTCIAPTSGTWQALGVKAINDFGEVVTAAGQLERMYVMLYSPANGAFTGPGSGSEVVFTVYVNGVATDLACTMTGSVSRSNNVSDSATVAVGDVVTVVKTTTGATPTSRTCCVSMVFRGAVAQRSTYGANFTTLNSATRYVAALCGQGVSATRATILGTSLVGTYGDVTKFMVEVADAPGMGKTWTIDLMKNGVAIAAAQCVITGAATTDSADFTTSVLPCIVTAGVPVSAADELSIRIVPTGSPTNTQMKVGVRFDATSLEFVNGETMETIATINDNISNWSRNLGEMYAAATAQYGIAPASNGSAAEVFTQGEWPDVDGADFNVVIANTSVSLVNGPGSGKVRSFTPRYWDDNKVPTAGFVNGYSARPTISGTATYTGQATVGGATQFVAYPADSSGRRITLNQRLTTGVGADTSDGYFGFMLLADSYDLTGATFDGTVTSIVPDEGPVAGGTAFTITGSGFTTGTVNSGAGNITGVSSVKLKGISATSVVVVNNTTITGVSGESLTAGTGDVVINFTTDLGAPSAGTLDDGWTYIAAEGWYEADPDDGTGPIDFYGPTPPSGSDPGGDLDWNPDTAPGPYGWWYSIDGLAGAPLVVDGNATPKQPRAPEEIVAFATGAASHLQGQPGCAVTFRNKIVYAARGYTVGTDGPPLRVYDGVSDRFLVRVPNEVSTGIAKGIMAMITANNTVYLSTLDNTVGGRVFQFDLDTSTLTQLGGTFTEVPYALCWYNGRLWCGTNDGDASDGKLYSILPGVETLWTLAHSMATETLGGICSLASFQGNLMIGSDNVAMANGKVLKRSSLGAYTVSETGTGTSVMNGYYCMAVFEDNLYAAYYSASSTVMKIRKFDGTSWSTVYTGAAATALATKPIAMFIFGENIYLLMMGLTGAALIRSDDGTTWDDLTAFLPPGTIKATPAFATLKL